MQVKHIVNIDGLYIESFTGNREIVDGLFVIEKNIPNIHFSILKWNFDTLEWEEGLTQAEIDEINYQNALVSETEKYKIRQCDGVTAYAKISAEFRLAKLNGVITEEAHAVIEQTLIVVRNEVLSGQWKSARIELENIGSTIIGVELYDRLYLQLSDYIALSY